MAKVKTTHHIPWLLGIVLLPVLMVGTVLFAVVTSVLMALAMIPLALMGKLTFELTTGK